MKLIDIAKLVLSVLLMGATVALAAFDPVNDDTDIFLANPSITAERPNVLIIIDNTANWNSAFTNEKNALVQVINGLTDQYNVGLMIMSDANIKRSGSDSSDGAYVRYHVRQMTPTNKSKLTKIIADFHQTDDKGDNNMLGMALYEAYLYFGGRASRAGDDQSKVDFDGTSDPQLTPLTEHALPASTTPPTTFPPKDAAYRSPVKDGCARNFIIFISNGPSGENATSRAELEGYLGLLTGVSPPTTIAISPDGQQGNWADEMARYMANADVVPASVAIPNNSATDKPQNVYTYVVEVNPDTSGQGNDMTALAKSIAVNGKGKYFGVTSSASGTAIVDALNAIFSEVQAVNSVFASTTLPVSVNVRGTNLNQVYIGVFRPDPAKAPRWLGNLKMYNLALNTSTNTVFLADAKNGPPPAVGAAAENTTTGFVSQAAVSFWTADSGPFWNFRDVSVNGLGGASDKPDGDLVEKGGAAQKLRTAFPLAEDSTTARKLYTCTTGDVDTTAQDCVPQAGFQLSRTPFQTNNKAITDGSLDLETRPVSPLTAYTPKNVASVTDRLLLFSYTNASGGATVTSITNGAITRPITSLTTAIGQAVGTVNSDVANIQSVAITSIAKVSGSFVVTTAAAIPSNFANTVGSAPTVTISGNSVSDYNGTFDVSSLNTGAGTFVINAGGNPGTGSGGTATMTNGIVPSTTATVTLNNHGYVSGQPVTIANATPGNYNGTFNITKIDNDIFKYTMTTAPGTAGNATGAIIATGNTTTATATVSPAFPSTFSGSVNVNGASDAAYNGTKTVLGSPAPSTTQFSYSVGATAIGPNTNALGVTVSQGGSTTVTVTTSAAHTFADLDTIIIGGSDVTGYNGAWPISCPTAAEVGTFGAVCTSTSGHTQFTFTTPTVLAANSSATVFASATASRYVTASAPGHGLQDGDEVIIEGPAPFAGTFNVHTTFGKDDIFQIDMLNTPACNNGIGPCTPVTQTGYTVRPTGGINNVTLITGTRPLAYVYLPAHGYPHNQEVRIDGASPTDYNGIKNIRVCTDGTPVPDRIGGTTLPQICNGYQTDRFSYILSSAPGANVSSAVTSSIKSTTARATSPNHGLTAGTVSITGATPDAFNSTSATITVVNANTFTYTLASPQGDASGSIKVAQLVGSGSGEREKIIKWVRGEDNYENENNPTNTSYTDIRASVHGDVLHSRPAVVNYNRVAGDDDVYIFYGANDGVFHAVKGGYAIADSAGNTPGKEVWGFVAKEFFPQLKRLRNNGPIISSSFKRPYFMDGSIGVYTKDDDGNGKLGDTDDKVNLYISNRRGGRFVYALDVNDPLDPKFLWKIDTSTTGFAELGQTWSQPTVVTNLADLTVPVLVFGAGYDPAVEDIDPTKITSVDTDTNGDPTNGAVTTAAGQEKRKMGRGIYVVNALTGALIWSVGRTGSGAKLEVADMIYAIPSDVTVVRNESGGAPDRAYVGDTGGNVWRFDFKSDPANTSTNLDLTKVTKLASLADQSTAANRRKFLFPPDVVGQSGFDAVLIGSGDREHPFDASVTNRFYMLKDKGGDGAPSTGSTTSKVAGTTTTTTTTCDPTIKEGTIADTGNVCPPDAQPIPGLSDLTSNCIQDASECLPGETPDGLTTKLGTDRGWYITLATGEKVVGSAISLGGTTFFNTNTPSASAGGGACGSNLGIARQYQVATADATATSNLNAVSGLTKGDRFLTHAGGGYLPSPVQVVVTLGGKPVQAVISGIQVSTPAGATLSARLRKYWYKEVDPK